MTEWADVVQCFGLLITAGAVLGLIRLTDVGPEEMGSVIAGRWPRRKQ